MTSALYSVSVTTLYAATGPDPFQVYAVLYSDGRLVDWPSTLTRISISDLPPITSISAITKSLFDQSAKVTGSRGFGQLHSDSVAVPWPATARGVIVADSATATSATSASSATSGTATPASTDTKTGTSNDPTSTSSPLPAVSSHSTGISTGATAGIAIGCALFGLAIGLLAAFCIVKRKGKRNSAVDNIIPRHELEAYPTDKVVVRHELEAYPPDKATPVSAIQLSQFLLEATPDQDIAHESQSIGALIDQHVESYYHRQPVTVGIRALASALNQLGFPLNTKSVALDAQGAAALCLDPQSRQVGLRHVLVRVLFSSIDVRSSYGPSMLPAPAASFLEAIPPAESDRFGDAQGKHPPPAHPPHTEACLPETKTAKACSFLMLTSLTRSKRASSSRVAQAIGLSSPSGSQPADFAATRGRRGRDAGPGASQLIQLIPGLLCRSAAPAPAGGPPASDN